MKTSKALLAGVLFAVLGLLFMYMAGSFTEKLPEQRVVRESDYPDMKTVVLKKQQHLQQREFSGTVIADQRAILSARLTARVADILVDVGDSVRQGDVLMRLESDDLDARVQQTIQALSSAQARLNAARKEFRRVDELVKKNLLSKSEFDRAESELKTAQAGFRQAQATVSEAETTLNYSIISAPFDGVITQKNVNRGDTATPGMQLVNIYNPATLQLHADIPESQIKYVKLGSQLAYQLPSYQLNGKGEVVEISPAVDSTSRSFVVKLKLDNTQHLYPGSFGRLSVVSGQTSQLFVPSKTLYHIGQLDYVKVVENGTVLTKLVQLGENNVVRKGLIEGENLVVDPLKY